LTPT
jgi:hypothetical protein